MKITSKHSVHKTKSRSLGNAGRNKKSKDFCVLLWKQCKLMTQIKLHSETMRKFHLLIILKKKHVNFVSISVIKTMTKSTGEQRVYLGYIS